MKKKLVAAAIVALTMGSIGGIGHADVKSPGQCNKQGPSNCSGNSECSGPHFLLLPLGQQKKC